jgi:hypothetical protein
MWTKTHDGSIVDTSGRVIYFSTERFVNDICLGDCCFICGAKPSENDDAIELDEPMGWEPLTHACASFENEEPVFP